MPTLSWENAKISSAEVVSGDANFTNRTPARALTNTRLWLTVILGIALIIRVAWVLVAQTTPVSDAADYDRLAWSLASDSGYTASDGTPTAYRPVGYPAFLSAVYAVFGHSWIAGGIANAVLWTVTVGLTYALARIMLPARTALIAALVVALWPSHILGLTSTLLTEALHTMLVLSALLLTYWAIRLPGAGSSALLGLCIGISVYVRPVLLLFPVVFGVVLALQPRVSPKMVVGLSSVAALVMLGAMLPWSIRNYVAMDGFVVTSTNGGINLLIGNGPDATGRYHRVDKSMFSDTSEMTVYRESIDLAVEHVLSEPLTRIQLLPAKFFYLWAGEGGWTGWIRDTSDIFQSRRQHWVLGVWWFIRLCWAALVLTAAAATVTRPVRYWLSFPAVLFPALILYWTAFHMPFFGAARFHAQMIPVIVVIAVHLLEGDRDWLAWIRPFRRGRHSPDLIADQNAANADDP